jgi:branched-chain amino acid aminotransferase
MKAYKGKDGKAYLFRPTENIKRFNRSCERMCIPQIDEKTFLESLNELIKLEKAWIPTDEGSSLYIRPYVFATEAAIKANPSLEYRFAIICSPVSAYFSSAIAVKIEERFSRAAPGGFGYAKAAGNYAGQFYPTELAKAEGYQQVVWTDANTHSYIEEAGTMNIFVRLGDKLFTSPTSDTILDGITRKSMLTLCKDLGIEVEERSIAVAELLEGFETGELKELFGVGTAAVVSEINSFGYQGIQYSIDEVENPYAPLLKKALTDIQLGRTEDPYGWRYEVI